MAFLSIDKHYTIRSMGKRARHDRETPTLRETTSCHLHGKPSNVTQQQLDAESILDWLWTSRHSGLSNMQARGRFGAATSQSTKA